MHTKRHFLTDDACSALLWLMMAMATLAMTSCTRTNDDYATNSHSMTVSGDLSNQHVTAIAEDSTGYIWIGTERGLNRYDGSEYCQYFHNPADTTSLSSNFVSCLFVDSHRRLWVGGDGGVCVLTPQGAFHSIHSTQRYSNIHQIWETKDGRILVNAIAQLYVYDPKGDSLKLAIDTFDPAHAYVNHCFADARGDFWSVVNDNVRLFDGTTFRLKRDIATRMKPHYAYLCQNGELWIVEGKRLLVIDTRKGRIIPSDSINVNKDGTITTMCSSGNHTEFLYGDQGLAIYDRTANRLTRYGEAGFPFEVPDDDISHLFIDSHHNIWIGFQSQGIAVRSNEEERFNADRYLSNRLWQRSVVSLTHGTEAGDDIIYLMTNRNELLRYDTRTQHLSTIDTRGVLRKPLPDEVEPSILVDRNCRLWVATVEKVMVGQVVAGRYVVQHTFDEIKGRTACIAQGPSGRIYVGTGAKAFYQLNPGEKLFREVKLPVEGYIFPFKILERRNGDMVLGLALRNPLYLSQKTGRISTIPIAPDGNFRSLVTALMEDRNGIVWIGIRGQGVMRYNAQTQALSKVESLSCDEVCDIVEDNTGKVWISTLNGLNKYDDKTQTLVNYYATDGIGGNQFNQRAAIKLCDGRLIFGATHGVTIFNPAFKLEPSQAPLVFDNLSIDNHIVRASKGAPIDRTLSLQPKVKLNYRQHSFTVSFSSLNYKQHSEVHYFYKLEGYNRDWVDIRGAHEVYFASIPSGHYTLMVKAASDSQSADDASASLDVSIATAPWASWWAWLIYIAIAVAFVYYLARNRLRALQERQRQSFFANISHEFRTPLTMIAAPATQLADDEALTDHERRLASTIRLNAQRMLRLVNQLLDFNRLENDALRLQVSNCDVKALIRQAIDLFRSGIHDKDITLRLSGLDGELLMPVDADKIDKVMTNLLSNALKYTPRNGEIICALRSEDNKLTVTVSNTGSHIPDDKLGKIFEKYYQVGKPRNYGTGIGLYFSHRLMQLHHGEIHCQNTPDGVCFTFSLPLNDIYSEDEHAKEPVTDQAKAYPLEPSARSSKQSDSDSDAASSAKAPLPSEETSNLNVFVVDDDPGIVNYLKLLLSPYYTVRYAYDAESALSDIGGVMPDLILSDVAMPGKDGYWLCQQVKDDLSTCHIPVVLVTAKTTKQDQLAGLGIGADAYITKPFDPDYLIALIKSQLDNRRRLQHTLSEKTNTKEVSDNQLNPQDKKFMDDLYALMERELANDELNINAITRELLISRSKLYYKIKGLTGMAPNAFFKSYKLNRAAELLKEGSHNVSEVAFMTGFSSLTVFSRNFKAHFGMTPTEYQKG